MILTDGQYFLMQEELRIIYLVEIKDDIVDSYALLSKLSLNDWIKQGWTFKRLPKKIEKFIYNLQEGRKLL